MANNDGISGLISEKLDKNNFHAWKFRMLMGKGYWEYIEGDQVAPPEIFEANATPAEKVVKDWNQGARKVMYWLFFSV